MYRFIPLLNSSRCLLLRKTTQYQLACLSRLGPLNQNKKYDVKVREPCPQPPPPPPPPPKDERLVWGTLAFLVLTTVFTVFARGNPEIRDWLSIYAPWFDDMIAMVFEENMTREEYVQRKIQDVKDYFLGCDDKPQDCAMGPDGKTVPVIKAPEKPKPPAVCKHKDEDDEDSPCDTLAPPFEVKHICELENCITDLGLQTVNNYMTARDACIVYNKLIYDVLTDYTIEKAKNLPAAQIEREELVEKHSKKAENTYNEMQDMKRYFRYDIPGTKEQHAKTQEAIKDYEVKICAVRMEYQRENDLSLALTSNYQQVQEAQKKFIKENETMLNGTKFDCSKPVLCGDPDLYLYHAYRYLQSLRAELADATPAMTDRIDRAIDTLPKDDASKKKLKSAIQTEFNKKKATLVAEYQKKSEEQRKANEITYKECIQRQKEIHEENLKTKLIQKEKEAKEKLNKMVADEVAAHKKIMAKQRKEMEEKVKVVENKLNEKLKAEKETRRSQELYTAGTSLLAATKKGESIVKVDKELKAIQKAAAGEDKLVLTVLKAVPQRVWDEGVVPESKIREKYHVMEQVALKVALVESEGAPLPIYALSWLQSLFLFMKLRTIPQAEIDKTPTEPFAGLDTFDLLQRARYYIDRGNVAMAARYVNSLQGASRAVASTWYDAAKSHLETRQAAEAVLAHAAALGLQYL